jgi:hypothetical protein
MGIIQGKVQIAYITNHMAMSNTAVFYVISRENTLINLV